MRKETRETKRPLILLVKSVQGDDCSRKESDSGDAEEVRILIQDGG
jgi:hypothetical protein